MKQRKWFLKKISKQNEYQRSLHNITIELQKIIDWNKNVDFDFLEAFKKSEYFVEPSDGQPNFLYIGSKSQADKYSKEISFFSDHRLMSRKSNHISAGKRYLGALIKKIESAIEHLNDMIWSESRLLKENSFIPELKELEDILYRVCLDIFPENFVDENVDSKFIEKMIKYIYSQYSSVSNPRIEDFVSIYMKKYARSVNTDKMRDFVKKEDEYQDLLYSVQESYISSSQVEYIQQSTSVDEIKDVTQKLTQKLDRIFKLRDLLRW